MVLLRPPDRLGIILDRFEPLGNQQARTILLSEIRKSLRVGENPYVTAKRIGTRLKGVSLTRAATIARTEQMHARWVEQSREFSRDVSVTRWQWQNTSSNPCEVCAVLEGREFPKDEPLNSHPNCRCTMIPVVVGYRNPISRGQSGPAKIRRMSHVKRTALLGRARADYIERGGKPEDLLTTRTVPIYGTIPVLRPLSTLPPL